MPRTVVIAEPNVPTRVGDIRVTVKLERLNRCIVYIDHPPFKVDNSDDEPDDDES
jgi:hypothetical protein